MTVTRLVTVGHGTLPADTFVALLQSADLHSVVDVRSYPGSRRNPQYGREAMERWMDATGLRYHWVPALGGRRSLQPGSKHVALRNDAFRAYAGHMETSAFRQGLEELLGLAGGAGTAVMCSESVWWRCHRRLLADHLVLVEGIEVAHLMHDGRLISHSPTGGVRVAHHSLAYDVGVQVPLPGA
jgi:uncharacterized protein (DUF488 family)